MILKSTTEREEEETTLHLSAVDQNVVRVYTQVFLTFPFPNATQRDVAEEALRKGLHATLQNFPFLAGKLSLADDHSGKLVLTYPTKLPDIETSDIFAVEEDNKFRSYSSLKEDGMPPDAFLGSRLRPADFTKYPGISADGEGIVNFDNGNEAPVMRVQAVFISGGLILSMYVHHAVMDCAGINVFWNCFAENISALTSKAHETGSPATDYALRQLSMRQELNERAATHVDGQLPSAEAYVEGVFKYNKSLPEDTECALRIFTIPADRIRNYREHLKQYLPDPPRLTICNVLAALLWIHVTRARAFRRGNCGDEKSKIGIATDMRKRMNPPLAETYTGNMAIFTTGSLTVKDVTAEAKVTEHTIVPTIREVQKAVGKVDNNWASQHVGFFKSIDPITDNEVGLAFRFGMDIYITSWMNFGADIQWNIPGTDLDEHSLGGRPEFIRRSYGPADGGMMIMPRRRHLVNGEEAPYEVMVRLAEVDMNRLMEEEGGFREWADRVI
ncbi:trichothecene 3-O-acetyltransferas-like protein [Bimuria novae-zelandiae CBS 107.79]|uniref:Trichothecene 3-O-acetyltransferas-like protein n=1 Tax=Bimuria novae-zelandiae CBS 107.79 TaxID=1447943 RepID=A0A6A5VEP8_9PLEO|nr:trichothecene 3-O-acetyltransferas-like protein [Bimuria novae-zelandiae CBS 107.79]